jgi:ribulose-phosphate 3-epimerase
LNILKKLAKKPLDVHLMIVDPDRYTEAFKQAGASVLTVHYEACQHLHRSVQNIRQQGMKAGVAINPHTPVTLLEDILPETDVVCMMSVNPGFGGQKFIENTYRKISALKEMVTRLGTNTLIEIDGGVDLKNYQSLIKAGADILVAGNAVFSSADPAGTIMQLKKG